MSVTECLLCWKNLQHQNRAKGVLHYCYQLISLFHQSFQRQSPKEITGSTSGHSKVNPKERQPAAGGHSIGQGVSPVLGVGPPGYKHCYQCGRRPFGLENTVMGAGTLRSHRHLHTLSVAPMWTPPPQPVPGDRRRQSTGRSWVALWDTQWQCLGSRTQLNKLETNHRAGARSCALCARD